MEAKCLYYEEQIKKSKNRAKTTWNIVKSLTGRKPHHETKPNLYVFDKPFINTKMIAESFNKYFLSIVETIIKSTFNNSDISSICNKANKYLIDSFKITFTPINYSYVTTNEIGNIIDKLKMTNSSGYDEISIKVLKSRKHFIISPLTYIINRSLATGKFPDRLKFSEIKPIYKNGDRNVISNYRPISLLMSFSKIFERVVFVRLCHLTINSLDSERILPLKRPLIDCLTRV
jgi:Notch-like protein